MAKTKAVRIITIIVFVLVFALVVGVIGYFSNCFTVKPSTFYVVINGTAYSENTQSIHIARGDNVKVVTLNDSYDVAIYGKSTKDNNFGFIVGQEEWEWHDVDGKDFTDSFCLTYAENKKSFVIDYGSILDILSSKLFGYNISLNFEKMSFVSDKDLFDMIITSGKASITFGISIDPSIPSSLELSTDKIIF